MFRTPARRVLPLAFIPPCIPTWARHAPAGRDWVHEIKHDGYRLMVRRQGDRVRLFTRRGFDWSHRFPLVVEAAGSLRVRSISIDGEAVVCGDDGVSDFDRLHSQGYDGQVLGVTSRHGLTMSGAADLPARFDRTIALPGSDAMAATFAAIRSAYGEVTARFVALQFEHPSGAALAR